jgi:uncharacterized protein (DUF433 family)
MPSRAPVHAIADLIRAGEPDDVIAADHGLTIDQVKVIRHLVSDLTEEGSA